MKKIIIAIIFCAAAATLNAQFLKRLKAKVNSTVNNSVDKAIGIDKLKTDTEKKEAAASGEYSDATENHEKPIFVDKAPGNGRLVLKLKKDDRFSGGYIQLKGQPKKGDFNANVLDYINARVVAFYPRGEITENAIYIDGKRIMNDSSTIAIRPQFINYEINKTDFFTGTETKITPPAGFGTKQEDVDRMMKAGGYSNMSEADFDKMAAAKMNEIDKLKNMPPGQQAAYMLKNEKIPSAQKQKEVKLLMEASKNYTGPSITQGNYSFKYGGKQYGPFTGVGIGLYVLKSMTDGNPFEKFYGLGAEPFIGEKQFGYHAIIQTEKKLVKINDYLLGGLYEPTYPTGAMVVVQGKSFHFTNGTTIPVPQTLPYVSEGFGVQVYGTDSGHVVTIPTSFKQETAGGPKTAWIDYKIKLSYPLVIDKQHLLIATNPAKSVFYKNHILYYANGTQKTIDNVGDAQLYGFNGKDYLLWFEMMKVADGHEIYVCQKELK